LVSSISRTADTPQRENLVDDCESWLLAGRVLRIKLFKHRASKNLHHSAATDDVGGRVGCFEDRAEGWGTPDANRSVSGRATGSGIFSLLGTLGDAFVFQT
jgi:hypothetical protein